jgi:hypothetical protein
MRIALILVSVALLAAACTGADVQDVTTTTGPSSTTSTIASDAPACLAGELPFVDDGTVAALDSQGRDAKAVGGIRWYPLQGCERIEIEFLSATGAPATRIGPVGVSMLSDPGIVRVNLSDDIVDSAVADTTLNGALVDHWYVVEDGEGGLVVDLHLNERTAARAFTTTSPARLVIDLVGTGDDRPLTSPISAGGIVLLSPQGGLGLYPLQVAGYAAPELDAIRLRLSDPAGVAIDRSVSTLSTTHVWHAFAVALNDGPSGAVDLLVGTVDSAGDPVFDIEVPLDLP